MCKVTTLYFVKSITVDKFVIFLMKVTIIFSDCKMVILGYLSVFSSKVKEALEEHLFLQHVHHLINVCELGSRFSLYLAFRLLFSVDSLPVFESDRPNASLSKQSPYS